MPAAGGVDAASLVSSAAAGATACAGRASCWAGLSATGISGLAVSGGDESSGCSAAVLSGSAGTAVTSGSAGVAAASGSTGFAVASGSAASRPRRVHRYAVAGCSGCRRRWSLVRRFRLRGRWLDTQHRQNGLPGFRFGCAKTGSGLACHDGVLANSSCAARSNAAAPSPNTSIDIDNTIAANRKRKPGSMDASSAFAGYVLRRPLSRKGTR